VGNYQVPVPRDWLVKVEPYGLTLLIDARPTRNATRNSIMIFPAPLPAGSFEFWISHKKQWLKEHKVTIEEQSLSFESEAVACLGGNELMQRWDATDTTSLECWSSGQLRLIFIGQRPGLQVLYSIIPKIRRVPQALPSQPKDSTR
jgi:hypothetical protein